MIPDSKTFFWNCGSAPLSLMALLLSLFRYTYSYIQSARKCFSFFWFWVFITQSYFTLHLQNTYQFEKFYEQ
jgi:hypothetical protein